MKPSTAPVDFEPLEMRRPEDWERFSQAFSSAPLESGAVERQAPDAGWLLVDDRQAVVARCSLWWRRVPRFEGGPLGVIGHYAARDRTAGRELLGWACRQLRNQGCALAVGPMDGNTWQNYRFVVERGPEPPFFLEPDHPADWPDHFADAGFTVLARYASALNTDLTQPDPAWAELTRRATANGVRLRTLPLDESHSQLRRIHALTLEAFRDSFLFTPLAEDAFIAQYLALEPCVRPELVLLAERDDELIGYLFAVPDVLQARRGEPIDTFIIKTLAVHPRWHGTGLGRLLAGTCHSTAHGLGFRRAIHALMLDTSAAGKLSRPLARPLRRYALFSRPLRVDA